MSRFDFKKILKRLKEQGYDISHVDGSHYHIQRHDEGRPLYLARHGRDVSELVLRDIEKELGIELFNKTYKKKKK